MSAKQSSLEGILDCSVCLMKLPAELKHINKRRERHQQELPQ